MTVHCCEACDREVSLQLQGGMVQGVSRLTTQPLRLLCPVCVARLNLTALHHSGFDYVRHDGEVFLRLGPAFLHSAHPESAYIYRRFP